MPSALDVNLPVDGAPARKSDLRNNFVAAKRELEHGGYFKAPPVGTVERKVADRLGERMSVKDFGAKGDDSTDDAVALQAALNSGRKLYFPPGIYKVGSPLTFDVTKGLDIEGESPNPALGRSSTIVGTFTSADGEPLIHPTSGYINKDNTWVNGSGAANKGYLHAVIIQSLTIYANGTWGHCVQSHNIANPSCFRNCTFGSNFRGLFISQGFDIEVSNCRFAGSVFLSHDWTDEALMLKCFGFYGPGHGSLHTCSSVGWGVGFWINGYSMSARALRAECNYIGVRLGGGPNLAIDELGAGNGILSRSSLGGFSLEANHIGMRVETLAEGSTLCSVTAQGSPVGAGRPFNSKTGIEIVKTDTMALVEGLLGTGDFTHYPIIFPKAPFGIMRSIQGLGGTLIRPYPKGIAGVNGFTGGENPYFPQYSINQMPINFVRHNGLSTAEHTVTAFSDLQLRGLKGLDVYNTVKQPNNFGKIETVASGSNTKVVAFRDTLDRPQIDVQPVAETDAASTLAPGTYYYAITMIRRTGETTAITTNLVTVTGTGKRVRLGTYGQAGADAMRVYRGTAAGRWDGCFEIAGLNGGIFLDTGQAFTGLKDWPPSGTGGVPSEHEPDANYAVVVTPSWGTTCWVTGKATTGFTINFGTPGPAGATVQWLLFRP